MSETTQMQGTMTQLAIQRAEEDAALALLGVPPTAAASAAAEQPPTGPDAGAPLGEQHGPAGEPGWPPPEHGAIGLPDEYPSAEFPALRAIHPDEHPPAPAAKDPEPPAVAKSTKLRVTKPGRITFGGYSTYLALGAEVDPEGYGMEAIARFREQGVVLEPIDG